MSNRSMKTAIKNLNNHYQKIEGEVNICFTGGEPLLDPHFFTACEEIVQYDDLFISIDTNATVNIDKFMKTVPANKTDYIYISSHILEREKTPNGKEELIRNVTNLMNNGYNTVVNYVMYPTLVDRFIDNYEYFKQYGIVLTPKTFKGFYQNKFYPNNYDNDAKKLISKYSPEMFVDLPSFKNKECNAGYSFLRIDPYGNIHRCFTDRTKLGNVFDTINGYDTATSCSQQSCIAFDPEVLLNEFSW